MGVSPFPCKVIATLARGLFVLGEAYPLVEQPADVVRTALHDLEAALIQPAFDPAVAKRTFALGMPDAFDGVADFSGMNGKKNLKIGVGLRPETDI